MSDERLFASLNEEASACDTALEAMAERWLGEGFAVTVSAHDVARELRRRQPAVPGLKTHKLCYYAQGWFLAWKGAPLFHERIDAWDLGPVVTDLWHDEAKGRNAPPARPLDPEMHVVLDFVVSRYGRLSGRELTDLTHAGSPWRDAYEPGGNVELRHDALRRHFATDDEQMDLAAQARKFIAEQGLSGLSSSSVGVGDRLVKDETEDLEQLLHAFPR